MAQTKKAAADKAASDVSPQKITPGTTKKKSRKQKSNLVSNPPQLSAEEKKVLEERNKAIEKAMLEAQDAVAQAVQITANQSGYNEDYSE